MNRIVLIGNGFDLAHGLETRHQDFLDWYWRQRANELANNDTPLSEDPLCQLLLKSDSGYSSWRHFMVENKGRYYCSTAPEFEGFLEGNLKSFFLKKSDFFIKISDMYGSRWGNIEDCYFDTLKNLATNQRYEEVWVEKISQLNMEMSFVQDRLVDYLSGLPAGKISKDPMVEQLIYSPLSPDDIAVEHTVSLNRLEMPERVLLLSFNYTNMANLYCRPRKAIANYIHGRLSDPRSIIFGYGDEMDALYRSLQERNNNNVFEKFKSPRYLETDCYRNLLRFIDAAPYQVFIMGHSCGKSDRTLLNTLFEHPNCASIKPFYHVKDDGSDNYLDLVQNISRIFTDMKLMRDRVVNKTYCTKIK